MEVGKFSFSSTKISLCALNFIYVNLLKQSKDIHIYINNISPLLHIYTEESIIFESNF